MVDEVIGEELLENIELTLALHLFSVAADNSLGSFGCAVGHRLAPIVRWRPGFNHVGVRCEVGWQPLSRAASLMLVMVPSIVGHAEKSVNYCSSCANAAG
jgi:hypothetical protein